MDRLIRLLEKEYENVNQAALLLGLSAFLSQILALVRDRTIANFIGPNQSLDIYYSAFKIPDLIFISIASLVSITVIMPFIMSKISQTELKLNDSAIVYLNNIFSAFLLIISSISILVFIFMPYLISLITPGFESLIQGKITMLSRIMLLSPILLGLSNLFGIITQVFRKFFIFSLSPIFYNLGIIFGVVFFYPFLGIYGLGIGVILGALMHFGIQFFSSKRSGFLINFSLKINWNEIKEIILISFPRTLGLAFNSFSLIFILAMASYLKEGSISIFNLSFNIQSIPLNIIGISYAVAVLPALTQSFVLKNIEDFKQKLKSSARAIIFWSLPVTFLFIVLRAQIVRVLLGSSNLTWENTRLIAASLAIFSLSVVAQGLIALFSRAHYARGNTKTPLLVNFFSSLSIVFFAFILIEIFNSFPIFKYFIESVLKISDISGTEILMLPLAYSLGSILNFLIHWFLLKKDLMPKEMFISQTFFQSLGASFFLGMTTYIFLNIFSPIFGTTTLIGVFLQGFISGILGIISAICVLYVLNNFELREILKTIKTKFWKTKVIMPSQEGL